MSGVKVLRIGIASREEMKRRTIDIAKGKRKRSPDEPQVWFSSFESLAKVLSEKNMLLLEIIRKAKPQSVAELAEKSGRAKSNLSRTLHSMERLGLVELVEGARGRKAPRLKYDAVRFEGEFSAVA
jgi:predicted transcriptional regulator